MFQILFQISDCIMNEEFHDYASLALVYLPADRGPSPGAVEFPPVLSGQVRSLLR